MFLFRNSWHCRKFLIRKLLSNTLFNICPTTKTSEVAKNDSFFQIFLASLLNLVLWNMGRNNIWSEFVAGRKKYFTIVHRQENRRLVGHFYDMKNRFWAVGCGIKGLDRLWATFEGGFFNFLWAKKNIYIFWKHCSVRTEKLHRKKVKKNYFFLGRIFFFRKTNFF